MSKATDAGGDVRHERPRRRSGLSPGLSQLLALLLVVGLVLSVVLLVTQLRTYQDNQRVEEDQKAAMVTAEQFALRMDNFSGNDLPRYAKQVGALLTTRAKGQFQGSFPAFEELYKKAAAVGRGTVKASGVQNLDPDSATVLVIHDRLVKSRYGTQQQYLRWTVDLNKVHGRWLVDKFTQD